MGELFALLSAIGFSTANVMVKKGTTTSSKNNGAFISILLTASISGIIMIGLGTSRGWPSLNGTGIFWFVLAGILTSFLGRTLLYSSIQHLGSIRSTAIKRFNPFFAVLLGVLLLGESITIGLISGMLLIFISFSILVYESYKSNLLKKQEKEMNTVIVQDFRGKILRILRGIGNYGYVYGLVSALCYAFGYVVRKNGLTEIPDPFFGAMLGSGVGTLTFVIMALFQERYRTEVKTSFTHFRPWLICAGVMTSAGQILYFVALSNTAVSRVALIASIEIIFTIFLSAWVFKTHENLTVKVITASLVSMVGAALIALG